MLSVTSLDRSMPAKYTIPKDVVRRVVLAPPEKLNVTNTSAIGRSIDCSYRPLQYLSRKTCAVSLSVPGGNGPGVGVTPPGPSGGVTVAVGVKTAVAVGIGVNVIVAVGVVTAVEVAVSTSVSVAVGVVTAVDVAVGARVSVAVGVRTAVAVDVGVRVTTAVEVAGGVPVAYGCPRATQSNPPYGRFSQGMPSKARNRTPATKRTRLRDVKTEDFIGL
jgi:hypothetical protein